MPACTESGPGSASSAGGGIPRSRRCDWRSVQALAHRWCPTLLGPTGRKVLAVVAVMAWLRVVGAYQVVMVDGDSMSPRLHHGDTIVVARLPYGVSDVVTAELPDGTPFRIYPLWPNHVATPTVPSAGIQGNLIYVGDGELERFDGKTVENSIVLMDFNSADNWLEAGMLGAVAVIFVEHFPFPQY